MRLLLLSNSTNFGEKYLDHAMAEILAFLGPVRRLAFVPFALADHEAYTAKARERFAREGIEVDGLAAGPGGLEALHAAEAIFVGGGNTFRLLRVLQATGHLEAIRARVSAGMPYMGASAGTNIAAPTIRTTNDMPIVEPEGFRALGLVPFQINPHYIDADAASRHMGETREERLREYLEENETPVIGLREGAWLRREGAALRLEGRNGARLFRRGVEAQNLGAGANLDRLLDAPAT
jgi:dipeptidase E